MSWFLLHSSLAVAASFEGAAALQGAVGRDEPGLATGGLELDPAWRVGRFGLGPFLEVGAGPEAGAFALAGLRARAWALVPDDERPGLSLFLGGGALFDPALGPGGEAGASVDLAARSRLRPRVSLAWRFAPDQGVHSGALSVGGVLGRRPPAPQAAPEPPAPTARIDPGSAMIWVPHPVCSWYPAEDTARLFAEVRRGQPIRVTAQGYLPANASVDDPLLVALTEAPPQGALIVAALPGDLVRVGDREVPVGADGTAVLAAPEGPLEVTVTGGGRSETLEVAIASGYAVWVRAGDPAETLVLFPRGAAALSAEARRAIAAYAAQAGSYRFLITGSYSPEGSLDANQALGRSRAQVVYDAMLEAGVPEERLIMGDPQPPEPGLEPARQRNARIGPILVGGDE